MARGGGAIISVRPPWLCVPPLLQRWRQEARCGADQVCQGCESKPPGPTREACVPRQSTPQWEATHLPLKSLGTMGSGPAGVEAHKHVWMGATPTGPHFAHHGGVPRAASTLQPLAGPRNANVDGQPCSHSCLPVTVCIARKFSHTLGPR